MAVDHALVQRVRAIYGERLRGVFAFGSRVTGAARQDSDLDLAVWLDGPLRRRDTWLPWIDGFEHADPPLDPTFITTRSLDAAPPWLLEAVRAGVEIWFDPGGHLRQRLTRLRAALAEGTYRRRLFMGLPYYERTAS